MSNEPFDPARLCYNIQGKMISVGEILKWKNKAINHDKIIKEYNARWNYVLAYERLKKKIVQQLTTIEEHCASINLCPVHKPAYEALHILLNEAQP